MFIRRRAPSTLLVRAGYVPHGEGGTDRALRRGEGHPARTATGGEVLVRPVCELPRLRPDRCCSELSSLAGHLDQNADRRGGVAADVARCHADGEWALFQIGVR